MEGYGFAISSSHSVVRRESRVGPIKKPFSPSDPHANSNSESCNFYSCVKPKITSPITGKSYYHLDDDDDDDYKRQHGSPSEAYPMKGGDDRGNRPKSPVPGSPRKVPNEPSRPRRSSPLAATDLRHSAQPKPYSSGHGYGDYGGNDKEGRKPIGSTNRNNGSYDAPIGGYDDDKYDGYDGDGNNNNNNSNNNKKEGNMTISPVWNDKYDGYGGSNKGYGDNKNKEGYKPSFIPMQNGKYDGANKDYGGYGNHNNKEGYGSTSSPTRNGKYDGADKGYGDSNNKERYKPTISPVPNGEYDGANKGYGNYSNKEGNKPTSSPVPNGISSPVQKDKFDGNGGANKGYGGYGNFNNREGHKPTSSPVRNVNDGSRLRPEENYGGAVDLNKPKIGTSWPSSPRKGVQLSQPTNSIEKVMKLMKEAAVNDHSNKGGKKTTDSADLPYNDYDNYSRNHDGVDRSAPRNSNWATSLGNDSRFGEPRGKFDNGVVVGSPRSQISVPKPGMTNKNDYRETIERKDTTSWNNGNFSLSSRPQTPVTHVIDGREANNRTRATGPTIIDSRFVEKIGGTRI